MPSERATGDGPQALFAGTAEVVLGREANLSLAEPPGLRPSNLVAFQPRRDIGEDAAAPLGARPARRRLGAAGSTTGSRATAARQAGRDRVRRCRSAVRPDLLHAPHRPRHDRRPAQQGRLSSTASRGYIKGLIEIERSAIGTDSFLGEFGMKLTKAGPRGDHPEPRDRPARLPPGEPLELGRADRRDPDLLPESRGLPRDEARKFIVLGFLEPVVARIPLADVQDRLRELLEAKWAAGTSGQRRGGVTRASTSSASKRSPTARCRWSRSTARTRCSSSTSTARSAPCRASAATSTSSSTRAS